MTNGEEKNTTEEEVEVFDHTSEIEIKKDVLENSNNDMKTSNSISLQQLVNSSNGTVNIVNQTPIDIHEDIVESNDSDDINLSNEIVKTNNSLLKSPHGKTMLSDSELLYAFVGKKYHSFVTREFNFAAFFLTVIYLLFRKMYFYSLIVTILFLLAGYFLNNIIFLLLAYLVIGFILGLFVNKLYLQYSKNKIENIRFKNTFLKNDELLKKCSTKGGVSIVSVVIGTVINFLIITIVLGLYLYFVQKVSIGNLYSHIIEMYQNIVAIKEDEKYNGIINYDTKVVIRDEFSIVASNQLDKITKHEPYMYEYEYNNDGEECNFRLASVENYSNAVKLIDGVKEYNESSKPSRGTITINNIVWERVDFISNATHKYYYATNKNDKLFLVEYSMSTNKNTECNKFHNQLVNSIKIK